MSADEEEEGKGFGALPRLHHPMPGDADSHDAALRTWALSPGRSGVASAGWGATGGPFTLKRRAREGNAAVALSESISAGTWAPSSR